LRRQQLVESIEEGEDGDLVLERASGE
jgi:hypothetical protein